MSSYPCPLIQQLSIHEQDTLLVGSLNEQNANLQAQLLAKEEEALNRRSEPTSPPLSAAAAAGTDECNQHCLITVEAAQKRLLNKVGRRQTRGRIFTFTSLFVVASLLSRLYSQSHLYSHVFFLHICLY